MFLYGKYFMSPITHIKYNLDIPNVIELANYFRKRSSLYKDTTFWRCTNDVYHPYLLKVKQDLDVKGWMDFYFQEPNSLLLPHIDPKSKCSINFILTPNPVPVTFYENAKSIDNLGLPTHYTYSQAVLNTRVCHSVQTSDTERILLKICIENESYESVVARMKYLVK